MSFPQLLEGQSGRQGVGYAGRAHTALEAMGYGDLNICTASLLIASFDSRSVARVIQFVPE